MSIKLDDDFLIDFITKIMQGINKRTQEKIFKQVELCHKLALDSGAVIEKENCTYAILIYEILSCIRFYIFHSRQPYEFIYSGTNFCTLCLGDNVYMKNFANHNNIDLAKNIENFFHITIENPDFDSSIDISNFRILDTKTYLLRFFTNTNRRFIEPLQNSFLNWIAEDKIFLSKFDEIMSSLI